MDRTELKTLRDGAPEGSGRTRIDYFGQKTGQLFGWITGPDQEFIANWLPDVAREWGKPMKIVEIGTFAGSTARGLIVMSGGGTITCIDNMVDVHAGARGHHASGRAFWEDTIKNNGADLTEFATLIEGESKDIGAQWIDPIHLLVVDGDHHEEPAYTDMRQFGAHVVTGGYCLVDDYDMPEVVSACARYFDDGRWRTVHRPVGETAKIIAYQRVAP